MGKLQFRHPQLQRDAHGRVLAVEGVRMSSGHEGSGKEKQLENVLWVQLNSNQPPPPRRVLPQPRSALRAAQNHIDLD